LPSHPSLLTFHGIYSAKKLYFCGVTLVKEKHGGGPEIALTSMKRVKIPRIFSEKDYIFPLHPIFLDTSGKNTLIFSGLAAFVSRPIKSSSKS
jgi:hypothetical protein